MGETYPELVAVVLDATDARTLAEFYRRLLGYSYRAGDEPPEANTGTDGSGTSDDDHDAADWLVLLDRDGRPKLAVQRVDALPSPTWPDPTVPQQLHLDLRVATREELDVQHQRAMALGARVLENREDDPRESLIVYADPAGHPFCILVG